MKTILITAFEPFGGEAVNAAQMAVAQLNAPEGIELIKIGIPTVFRDEFDVVKSAIEKEQPDAVICVGQAAGRREITPERVAINVMDARIADNNGFQPKEEPIDPNGPAAYFSTLPIQKIRDAINSEGIPSKISNTAGTYVCNDVFYRLMNELKTSEADRIGGFIHVPVTPEQAAKLKVGDSMTLEKICNGLQAVLSAVAEELLKEEKTCL